MKIPKYIPREKLAPLLRKAKEKGKTVVFANGCFDFIHVGHLRYLQGARAEGDLLVVALNSDASVRRLKGPTRPIMPLAERLELVAALACVDYVTSYAETRAEKTLKMLRPDVQAKGTDYTAQSVPEAALMRSLGGRIAITGDPKDHSTTDLLKKLKKL